MSVYVIEQDTGDGGIVRIESGGKILIYGFLNLDSITFVGTRGGTTLTIEEYKME
jgi:hypothetical protein